MAKPDENAAFMAINNVLAEVSKAAGYDVFAAQKAAELAGIKKASAPEPAGYDFRNVPEPEKTLSRIQALMYDNRLTHGVKCAATVICLAFRGGPDTQLFNFKQTLTDERGYSLKLRTSVLTALSAAGLIEYKKIARQGTQITLLF